MPFISTSAYGRLKLLGSDRFVFAEASRNCGGESHFFADRLGANPQQRSQSCALRQPAGLGRTPEEL